jgi:hypothetical protein
LSAGVLVCDCISALEPLDDRKYINGMHKRTIMIRAVWRFLKDLLGGPEYGNPGKERPSLRGACLGVNIPSDTLIGEGLIAIPVPDIHGDELGCCWGWVKVANIE